MAYLAGPAFEHWIDPDEQKIAYLRLQQTVLCQSYFGGGEMMLCEAGDSLGEHSDQLYDLQQLAPKTVVPRVAVVILELELELELVLVLVPSMLQHMHLVLMIPRCDACIYSCPRNVQRENHLHCLHDGGYGPLHSKRLHASKAAQV
jgi:hypothetical protein